MSEALAWAILIAASLAAVAAIAAFVRGSRGFEGAGREVRDELRSGREESRAAARELREEVAAGLNAASATLAQALQGVGAAQQSRLEGMTKQISELIESNRGALDRVRSTFDARVKELQEGNEKKLDEMRRTVDEKLHESLEKRLGESFKIVSERLEAVHKGLGEMQSLAAGVGDLKRVLTNVKARGSWAEVQLGSILEQILAPDQFERNVAVRPDSAERVEFAIRLPGARDEPGSRIWLPIDSKFPQEDWLRLQDAADRADAAAVQAAAEALARTVRAAAREIHDKYVHPPHTTEFAILFLATEGLYAEVLRQPALADELHQQFHIVLAGPANLVAILSSLRMGFQTLAIERRASEVWQVLRAVKTEFSKFGAVLDKVKRQIDTAGRTLEDTGVRTKALERKLRSVEQLPDGEAAAVLGLPDEARPVETPAPADDPESGREDQAIGAGAGA